MNTAGPRSSTLRRRPRRFRRSSGFTISAQTATVQWCVVSAYVTGVLLNRLSASIASSGRSRPQARLSWCGSRRFRKSTHTPETYASRLPSLWVNLHCYAGRDGEEVGLISSLRGAQVHASAMQYKLLGLASCTCTKQVASRRIRNRAAYLRRCRTASSSRSSRAAAPNGWYASMSRVPVER